MHYFKITSALILSLFLAACGSKKEENTPPPTDNDSIVNTPPDETQAKPDFNVALDFMNSYVSAKDPEGGEDFDRGGWIEDHASLTASFKETYSRVISEGFEADPELGLGYDPILDAQDAPDSFTISDSDDNSGYVTVSGKDWEDFKVILKVVKEGDEWLVDGAGEINIPEDKRISR